VRMPTQRQRATVKYSVVLLFLSNVILPRLVSAGRLPEDVAGGSSRVVSAKVPHPK